MQWLPKHPVAMQTWFRNCFLVNFSMEPETLRSVIPRPLEPDVRNGKAFLSVVIADLEDMRPAMLPKMFGYNFTQIVYRAIVRNPNAVSKEFPEGERGVYFVRSDANNQTMCLGGNMFSFFHFNYAPITLEKLYKEKKLSRVVCRVKSQEGHHADLKGDYDLTQRVKQMPNFSDIKAAQEYFVELYAAFNVDRNHITTVRINRSEWDIGVVPDNDCVYDFMNGSSTFPKESCSMDSIFHVEDLYYYWHPLERVPIATHLLDK